MNKENKLKDLVVEAFNSSPEFAQKYTYWTVTRGKQPDVIWLYGLLENALGKARMQEEIYGLLSEAVQGD